MRPAAVRILLAAAALAVAPAAGAQFVQLTRCQAAYPCSVPFGLRYKPDPLLAAAYPIHRGSKVTVREAISSYGIEEGRHKGEFLEFILNRFKRLSRPLMLSLRNTFRRKGRLGRLRRVRDSSHRQFAAHPRSSQLS